MPQPWPKSVCENAATMPLRSGPCTKRMAWLSDAGHGARTRSKLCAGVILLKIASQAWQPQQMLLRRVRRCLSQRRRAAL